MAVDMTETYIWDGDVISYSGSQIHISDGYNHAYYYGSFSFPGSGGVSGKLTDYSSHIGSNLEYSVSGIKMSASVAYNYINAGDAFGLMNAVLAKNDTINGSAFDDVISGLGGNDIVIGNGGDDYLAGGNGKDVLTGGAGEDVFVFYTALSKKSTDTITDFQRGDDTIGLYTQIFTALSGDTDLSDNIVNGSSALDGNDYLIFNASNGVLYYDADGNGSGKAMPVATLTGIGSLSATDFEIIASL